MNINLAHIWGELLRSTSNNEAALRELLEGRPEIRKAKDLNYMFMNYLSIIHNISTIKMGGGWVNNRIRIPSDLEFIEMLKLLVCYTNDITAWIEDHDRTGAPWECIDDFYAESLVEVDRQCQRWWALANITTFNQSASPFTMPPPLLPTEESISKFELTEAPRTPELASTEQQSPSTASSSSSYQSTTASFNEHQMRHEFPPFWNDVAEPGFASHFTPIRRLDHGFSNNRRETGESVEQHLTTPVPFTPRLEQEGFAPSPNSNWALQTSDKQKGFFQPRLPPARKIAIPRLQKLGAFEPLLPPTQNSILRPSLAIGKSISSESTRKRVYTKSAAETPSASQRKRQAVGSETPQQNPVSAGNEVFTLGSEFPPGCLSNGSPGSALTNSGESYTSDESILQGFGPVNSNTAILRGQGNDPLSSKLNPDQADIHPYWDNDGAGNAGLGISSPPMDRGFSHFEGPVLDQCMDINMGYAGTGITFQNTIPFGSFMQFSPIIGSNSYSHQMPQHLYNYTVEMENTVGMNQSLSDSHSNVLKSRYKNPLEPRKAQENGFMGEDFGS